MQQLMIHLDISSIQLQLRKEADTTQVFDPVRKKWLVLTPEEHVRQYLLQYLINTLQYPASLIAVEKQINFGTLSKRYDVVVYNRNHQPWLLAECKAPEVTITEATLNQLLQYHNTLQCNYWVLYNGHQLFCADAKVVDNITWMNELPAYNS
ncbi:MAG: type I restriction enzyme HsdR N-terminal domain-containing protein [Bacteroidetes bacterium]|nr:type I restriction enzyme HsdR N-terminal domain-containing protein [Bacteroidota bacterium]